MNLSNTGRISWLGLSSVMLLLIWFCLWWGHSLSLTSVQAAFAWGAFFIGSRASTAGDSSRSTVLDLSSATRLCLANAADKTADRTDGRSSVAQRSEAGLAYYAVGTGALETQWGRLAIYLRSRSFARLPCCCPGASEKPISGRLTVGSRLRRLERDVPLRFDGGIVRRLCSELLHANSVKIGFLDLRRFVKTM